jgi:RNA polymerase sigma-70 factor (ECF subfamily)
MEQLNPDYCEALYLLYFESMSYAHAAQVMGKSIKQIDHLLERGKKKLRPLLEQEGITGEKY